MSSPSKTIMIRPITHVFGSKRPWHDNQPLDILHIGGVVVGSRWRIPNPPGTQWESWAPALGYGVFDNAGKLIFWSPQFNCCGLSEAVAQHAQQYPHTQAAE